MRLSRAAVGALSVLAGVALLIPVAGAQTVDSVMSTPVFSNSVFANSYVTGGATSTINGDVLSGLYFTTGASATINGDTVAVAATTLGASSPLSGSVRSGSATTLGAGASVSNAIVSGTTNTFGAGATSGSSSTGTTAPTVTAEQLDVLLAQSILSDLVSDFTVLPGNIATDVTFTPGVHEVTGLLTVTAGKTIFLDAGGADGAEFIFNISNYLAFGAGVKVVVLDGTPNTRVIWNATGGYITVGAGANIIGTVIAHGYVSTGATSTLSGVSGLDFNTCGGAVYSATSYVSVGAGATVGTGGNYTPGPPKCDTCILNENIDGSVTIEWSDLGDNSIDGYHVYRTNRWGRKLIGRNVLGTPYTDYWPRWGISLYEVYAVRYDQDGQECEELMCTGMINLGSHWPIWNL